MVAALGHEVEHALVALAVVRKAMALVCNLLGCAMRIRQCVRHRALLKEVRRWRVQQLLHAVHAGVAPGRLRKERAVSPQVSSVQAARPPRRSTEPFSART